MLQPEMTYEDQTFQALDLDGKSLKKSIFNDVIFENCSFEKSDWEQVHFNECRFQKCKLILTHLRGCRLQNVVFEECKLVGVDFYKCAKILNIGCMKSVVLSCNFTDLNLKGMSFCGSKLKGVYFTNTNLSEANFTETDLSETLFHQCNLTKADFTGAQNYAIDLQTNILKKARFSLPEAMNLLTSLEIEIS